MESALSCKPFTWLTHVHMRERFGRSSPCRTLTCYPPGRCSVNPRRLALPWAGVLALAAAPFLAAAPAAEAASTPVITIASSTTGTALTASSPGLSFEASDLALRRYFTSGNLAAYLKTLGSSVIRIGGNTVDQTFWTSTGATPAVLVDRHHHPGRADRARRPGPRERLEDHPRGELQAVQPGERGRRGEVRGRRARLLAAGHRDRQRAQPVLQVREHSQPVLPGLRVLRLGDQGGRAGRPDRGRRRRRRAERQFPELLRLRRIGPEEP